VWILAAKAARLMRCGGSAREIEISHVVGLERVFANGQGVIVGSWLLKVWPLEIAMAVGMWHRVPEICK